MSWQFLDGIRNAGTYSGRLKTTIRAFKYYGRKGYASSLGKKIAPLIPKTTDLIVPIPMDPATRRRRGYNHADLLAREVGQRVGKPVKAILIKTKTTKPNALLNAFARIHNVRGAFRLRSGATVKGKKICLIDDVVLSGSTLEEAAKVLKRAGAAKVWGVVVAKSKAMKEVQEAMTR